MPKAFIVHLENHDVAYVRVARAAREARSLQETDGLTARWVSSYGNDFNYDFHVSFTKEEPREGQGGLQLWDGRGYDGYPVSASSTRMRSMQFYTYQATHAQREEVVGAFIYLDITPKGRNEKEIMDWVRRHDEYEDGSTPRQRLNARTMSTEGGAMPIRGSCHCGKIAYQPRCGAERSHRVQLLDLPATRDQLAAFAPTSSTSRPRATTSPSTPSASTSSAISSARPAAARRSPRHWPRGRGDGRGQSALRREPRPFDDQDHPVRWRQPVGLPTHVGKRRKR